MKEEDIINHIIERINYGDNEFDIERELKRKDIDLGEYKSLIQKAEDKILAKRLEIYPRKNKITFIIWTSLTIISVALFFFILPKHNISENIKTLSIIGALIISFCGILSIMFYKTWEHEYIKKVNNKKKDYSALFILSILPSVFLYFIISWCFTFTANNILKETQEDAIAVIIDGSSIQGKRTGRRGKGFNHAEITVKFTTKDGKEIIAVEEVSTYKFKDFYRGQIINIVYSKDNPRNIDLLIDEDNIKQLKNSQEREIEPNDLINLTLDKVQDITSKLNEINYGWHFDDAQKIWINEQRKAVISIKNDGNQLIFISSKKDYNYTFPDKFIEMGFVKKSTKDVGDIFETGEKIFENEKYRVAIKSDPSIENSIITINRK